MKEKYNQDLKEIKDIMNRSTRFISLSGLSGVSTGITALAGAYLTYLTFFKDHDYLVYHAVELNSESVRYLLLIAIGTLIVSIGMAIFSLPEKLESKTNGSGITKQKDCLSTYLSH